MAIIAVLIFVFVFARPEGTSEFIRSITRFKFGLSGVEFERNVEAAARREGSPAPVRRALRETPTAGRLLWIDDHPENNVAEMELLRLRGLGIDVASTNHGGIQLLRSRPYDVVISDIGRDNGEDALAGLELPAELAEVAGDRSMPIIFYSSEAKATRIPNTVSTATPSELFAAVSKVLAKQ